MVPASLLAEVRHDLVREQSIALGIRERRCWGTDRSHDTQGRLVAVRCASRGLKVMTPYCGILGILEILLALFLGQVLAIRIFAETERIGVG
jgi:hypothetical protein